MCFAEFEFPRHLAPALTLSAELRTTLTSRPPAATLQFYEQMAKLTNAQLTMAEPIIEERLKYLLMSYKDTAIFREDPTLAKHVEDEVDALHARSIQVMEASEIPGNSAEAEEHIKWCRDICEREAHTPLECIEQCVSLYCANG